jgi:tetratricopeptide (TPR) repeat protein
MPLFGRKKEQAQQPPQPQPAPQAPVAPTPRSAADAQFQAAVELSNQELHSEAILAFQKVLELDPNFQSDIVHYGIALAYDAIGMEEQAIAELGAVVFINPSNVEAHIILGSIHARKGRYEEAAQAYERALAIKPGHELAAEMRRSIAQWKMSSSGEGLARLREDLDMFIAQAQKQFGVRLDFGPASLGTMDRLIDAGWNLQAGGIGVLRLAGTYIGEVIVRNIGGEWRLSQPVEESDITGLGRDGIRPFFMALEKFQKGKAGSLLGSFRKLATELGRR